MRFLSAPLKVAGLRGHLRPSRVAKVLFVSALAVVCGLSLDTLTACSDTVSFDASDWNHGSGYQTGWLDGEFFGQTTVFGNQALTISRQSIGTTLATADHFSRINESFFTGFAFQLDPGTTNNTASLANYERLDFSFSTGVGLDSFTLTDVDRTTGSWWDVVVAEGFATSTPGAVGSGLAANYAFEPTTNLTLQSLFGLQAVTPVATSGNVQNTPVADVTFSFAQGIRSFSIYYWNFDSGSSGAATQTIGIRGNSFDISLQAIPEPGFTSIAVLALLTVALWRRLRRTPAGSCRTGFHA